jgi:predicted transcriptional regulator
MTLTVRLDETLESALERYCTEAGVTKSRVVQQSLAAYLLASQPPAGNAANARAGAKGRVSANYRAFEKAGLIGAVALGGDSSGSADKARVRTRIAQRFAERKAHQGGA